MALLSFVFNEAHMLMMSLAPLASQGSNTIRLALDWTISSQILETPAVSGCLPERGKLEREGFSICLFLKLQLGLQMRHGLWRAHGSKLWHTKHMHLYVLCLYDVYLLTQYYWETPLAGTNKVGNWGVVCRRDPGWCTPRRTCRHLVFSRKWGRGGVGMGIGGRRKRVVRMSLGGSKFWFQGPI